MTTELVGDKAGLESIPYKNALERGDQYKKLFEEVLNFSIEYSGLTKAVSALILTKSENRASIFAICSRF